MIYFKTSLLGIRQHHHLQLKRWGDSKFQCRINTQVTIQVQRVVVCTVATLIKLTIIIKMQLSNNKTQHNHP